MGEGGRPNPEGSELDPEQLSVSTKRALEEDAKHKEHLAEARKKDLIESADESLEQIREKADAELRGRASPRAARRREAKALMNEALRRQAGDAIIERALNQSATADALASFAAKRSHGAAAAREAAQTGATPSEASPGKRITPKEFPPLKEILTVQERQGHPSVELTDRDTTIEARFADEVDGVLTLHEQFQEIIFERSGNVEQSDVDMVNKARQRARDIFRECNDKKLLFESQLSQDNATAAQHTLDETVALMEKELAELDTLHEIIMRRIRRYRTKG
ncbi:MAG: hypothetical protein HYZ09_02555 [Candidatus Kerfeldbacteria bacterium]|nr:hypothetical protein [Candidatus Kerfeldbacteria bacterium]